MIFSSEVLICAAWLHVGGNFEFLGSAMVSLSLTVVVPYLNVLVKSLNPQKISRKSQ